MMILMGFVSWILVSLVVALAVGPMLHRATELRDSHSGRRSGPTGRLRPVA
ncbi:MAG: hypothetical protein M3P91_05560 [Actinomycetota bacterium]|nr:hypothetical protein [Actinomycetota bacterium]